MKCHIRIPFTNQYVVVKGGRPVELKDRALKRYFKAQAREQAETNSKNVSIKQQLDAILVSLESQSNRMCTMKEIKATINAGSKIT